MFDLKLCKLLFVLLHVMMIIHVNGNPNRKRHGDSLSTLNKRAGNNSNGPVYFPGQPQPDPPTTKRIFLYNTTAQPLDNHIDAKKRDGKNINNENGNGNGKKKHKKHHKHNH